jgi:hypothetical protein
MQSIAVSRGVSAGKYRRGTWQGIHQGVRASFVNRLRLSMEAQTHLQIAERLCYIDSASADLLLEHSAEIGRRLNGLMAALRRKRPQP